MRNRTFLTLLSMALAIGWAPLAFASTSFDLGDKDNMPSAFTDLPDAAITSAATIANQGAGANIDYAKKWTGMQPDIQRAFVALEEAIATTPAADYEPALSGQQVVDVANTPIIATYMRLGEANATPDGTSEVSMTDKKPIEAATVAAA